MLLSLLPSILAFVLYFGKLPCWTVATADWLGNGPTGNFTTLLSSADFYFPVPHKVSQNLLQEQMRKNFFLFFFFGVLADTVEQNEKDSLSIYNLKQIYATWTDDTSIFSVTTVILPELSVITLEDGRLLAVTPDIV